MKKEHDMNQSTFQNPKVVLLFIMILFMTCTSYYNRDKSFQRDSESLAVGIITVAKYDIDNGGIKYGLRRIYATDSRYEYNSNVEDTYRIYTDGKLYSNMQEYTSQIGLQGWIYYFFTKYIIQKSITILGLGCCLLLSLVITFICYELYKKYGLLLATSFYLVCICSSWIRNFSTNLYWVEFTWFIPMLLGLICLNNLNKRFWLYPLFFLAILVKSACGYEYITVIMLSSIMFFVPEWFCYKENKQQSKLLFKTILCIGISSLLGFVVTFLIHSYIRGGGIILDGLKSIYHSDVLRRTFGNVADFHDVYANSLNASIFYVFLLYFRTPAGINALFLCLAFAFLIYHYRKKTFLLRKDIWLFLVTFITCVSWFILGKSHSYIHTHMNYVMWYMGFIQIGTYFVLKYVLKIFIINKHNINRKKMIALGEKIIRKLREEIIKE